MSHLSKIELRDYLIDGDYMDMRIDPYLELPDLNLRCYLLWSEGNLIQPVGVITLDEGYGYSVYTGHELLALLPEIIAWAKAHDVLFPN